MNPRFTIITPAYNCQATIGECIQSIYSQSIPAADIQHLVLDGDSKDDTVNVVASHIDNRTQIFSAPDKGMYDAVNKGLRLANGQIIGILNADDIYSDPNVLEDVSKAMEANDSSTAYGDLEYVSQNNVEQVIRYWHSGSFQRSNFRWGWMPPHPTFFVQRSVYEEHGHFRDDMKIAADYEIMLRFLFQERVGSVYVPKCLVRMRLGGMSNTAGNLWRKYKEDIRACRLNQVTPAGGVVACKMLRKLPQFIRRS